MGEAGPGPRLCPVVGPGLTKSPDSPFSPFGPSAHCQGRKGVKWPERPCLGPEAGLTSQSYLKWGVWGDSDTVVAL